MQLVEERAASAATGDSIAMLIDAWALMTGRYAGHRFERQGGVATTFANRPLPFFNLSTFDRPFATPAEFQDGLAIARFRALSCGHPSFLALAGDWAPDGWEDLAAEAGWLRSLSLVGMATDRLCPPRRPEPALSFRLVEDAETGRDLGLVNALAYAMPPELFDCVGELALWRGGAFGIVGYDQGRPVTCAAAFLVGDTIYVAMVATAPGLHGRGYGEAAMRRAIDYARQAVGPSRIWLHATEVGQPLYAAMGFESGAALVMLHLASDEGAA